MKSYLGAALVALYHFILSLVFPIWLHVPASLQTETRQWIWFTAIPPLVILTIARHWRASSSLSLFSIMAIYYLLVLQLVEVESGQRLTWLGTDMLSTRRGREAIFLICAVAGILTFGYGYFFLQRGNSKDR